MLEKIVEELSKTERNFIIQNGETTTGSESLKHLSKETEFFKSVTDLLKQSKS